MRNFSLQDKVCIFIAWVLMLTMHGVAEREYFHQSQNFTWDEARNYCQVCFEELVTVTPFDMEGIAHDLTSDYWIGLRKNLNSSSNPTNMSWTRWANGDPLTFQNWYPGWPVLKSSFPKRDCCSCSCTCPVVTGFSTGFTSAGMRTTFGLTEDVTSAGGLTEDVTSAGGLTEDATSAGGVTEDATSAGGLTEDATSAGGLTEDATSAGGFTGDTSGFTHNWRSANPSSSQTGHTTTQSTAAVTGAANMAECVRSPMVLSHVQETDENYMEDSCVAMLHFGAWVEKNCSDSLPFICYEDRFFGQATVTSVTTDSAQINWQPAPGPISHYSLEVKGDKPWTGKIYGNFSHNLTDLTAGTPYSVQVFPVKCRRRLNPQNVTFYTVPNKVTNLNVTTQTETCILLSWDKPAGNLSFYCIKYDGREEESVEESKNICNLTPGTPYTFIVLTVVNRDKPTWSEASNITGYTRPSKVSDLRVSSNTINSLLLTWMPPVGHATDFWVEATDDSNIILFNQTVQRNETPTQQEKWVTGLPMGAKIILKVTALTSDTWGDKVTVENYTVPGPISTLELNPAQNSLNATWTPPSGSFTSFTIELWLEEDKEQTATITTYTKNFESLKTAANYTVRVYSVSGNLSSPPVEKSKYTLPSPPTDAKVTDANKTHITLQWKPPDNIVSVNYLVKISSKFWGHNETHMLVNKTSHTFHNLISGTKYDFEVQTVVEQQKSKADTVSHCTEAEKREISLSMLCSSSQSLLCANNTMEEHVFNELRIFFEQNLGDQIFWKLEKQKK